jgi:hypothetical protein
MQQREEVKMTDTTARVCGPARCSVVEGVADGP